jgi:hypothetical protein
MVQTTCLFVKIVLLVASANYWLKKWAYLLTRPKHEQDYIFASFCPGMGMEFKKYIVTI